MTDKRKESEKLEREKKKNDEQGGGREAGADCQRGTVAWVTGDCLF